MNSLKVLHICNDFLGSKVHSSLYRVLDSLNVEQKIFVPIRSSQKLGANNIEFQVRESEIIYSRLLKQYHRLLFRWKIRRLSIDLNREINVQQIEIIHATTLFSDGAIALKLHKRYKIPFIVTIRNTDVFTFLKYRPDLAYLAHTILRHASKIVFVSQANMTSFFNHKLITKNRRLYDTKSLVINNGIDEYWHSNNNTTLNKIRYNKFLYVGKFDKNKNVGNLVRALIELKLEIPDIELGLVGGGGEEQSEILNLIKDRAWIQYHGTVLDKSSLIKIYRQYDIFCMVSYHETFGLVYIEALSQGLPLLYTQGQGVDGVFDLWVGEGVQPDSISSIKSGLKRLILNAPANRMQKIDLSRFRWSKVAEDYLTIYNSILKPNVLDNKISN